ncbi:MAG TPA: protein-L-isoaspartate(D-aspartate) O-methyltransferase [Archangium sp.]
MTSLQITDPRVAFAMALIDRADFLDAPVQRLAGRDAPLSIGHGQTTSQPSLIAWMIDQLQVRPGQKVLEIGTGCGYQTAILSQLGAQVFSMEILEPLAREAAGRFTELGTPNVTVRTGDGYEGWAEHAPFDRIIVAAGASKAPQPLIDQLAPGGRLIIPIGTAEDMKLQLVTRALDGTVATEELLPVRFVPLTGAPAEADRTRV